LYAFGISEELHFEVMSKEQTNKQTNKTNSVVSVCKANYIDRLSDHHLSAKLVTTLADRGCSVVSATNPHSS
jgi:hypothetical protein